MCSRFALVGGLTPEPTAMDGVSWCTAFRTWQVLSVSLTEICMKSWRIADFFSSSLASCETELARFCAHTSHCRTSFPILQDAEDQEEG
jgi:hypothetical protein